VKSDKSKDRDEGFKEEVSYGALLFEQISRCLKSSRGRTISGIDIGYREIGSVLSYDEYDVDVEHLVSLVSVIGDEEFHDELKKINEDFNVKMRELEKRFEDELNQAYLDSDDKKRIMYEHYNHVQALKFRYNLKRFNACLRLLKRQGVIIESLMRGGFK
jgi:superfamily I DNA/RNA helicase